LKSIFYKRQSKELDEALQFLELVNIKDSADEMPTKMPLGYLKRLEVARALATNPKVLLLDEPLAGLNQSEAKKMADVIVNLNRRGISIILIEHNLSEVLRICKRLIVLESGQKIAEGIPEDVIKNKQVISAYIGEENDFEIK
jgi:branched-chain amino acid transport system ATP-binding protein